MRTFPLYVALAAGLASYCLVLLASMDAPVSALTLLGSASLALISMSMGMMWAFPGVNRGSSPREPMIADDTGKE